MPSTFFPPQCESTGNEGKQKKFPSSYLLGFGKMCLSFSTFIYHLGREKLPLSQSYSPLSDLIPLERKPTDWIRGDDEVKKAEEKRQKQREEKTKYLGVEIFSLSSKNHTCPESGNIHTHRSLSSQSPWKQWALLIRPIPLSSVNSPRQHGLYHSSCKQGRTPALKELPRQFNGVSESFKGRFVVLSPSFAL